MTAALRRPELVGSVFGLESAAHYLAEVLPPWMQDLGLVIEKVEAVKPPGAPGDWQPGALLRLPFAARNCRDGVVVCGPALMALADSAMLFACATAWNGYRPMTPIDQHHAFSAAGEFRCPRGRTRHAHRSDHEFLSRDVVECGRPASGRNGIGGLCDVVSLTMIVRSVIRVNGVGCRSVAGNRAAMRGQTIDSAFSWRAYFQSPSTA
jgi:hypothetical protein